MQRRLKKKAVFKKVLDQKIDGDRKLVILRDPSSADINQYIMRYKSGNAYQIAISIDGHLYITNIDDEPVYIKLAVLKAYDAEMFNYLHSNYELISFKIEPGRKMILSPKTEQPNGSIVDLARIHTAIKNTYYALDASELITDETLLVGPNLKPNLTIGNVVSQISWNDVDWVGNGKKVDRTIMDMPASAVQKPPVPDEEEEHEDDEYD